MDITILNGMFLKKIYLNDDAHIKENLRLDALKNQGKKKMLGQKEKKRNKL